MVSFDVNHRSQLWPSPREAAPVMLELAQAADVVFVGLDEAAHLWGTRTPADVRRLLSRPGSLVVKDGAVGATAWEGDRTWFVPAPPVDVVEVVGAGDAFAAGWLAGHLRGLDAQDRLELGHLVAGHVLLTTSDDAQFPPSLHRTLAVQGKG